MPDDYQELNTLAATESAAIPTNPRSNGVRVASKAQVAFSACAKQRRCRMFRLPLAAICILSLAGVTNTAAAKNCNSDEKGQANKALERIENDQLLRDQLIALHAPFGTHKSAGDTDGEELLVQGGYIMAHDHDLRTSIWVTYRLTTSDIEGAVGKERVNCFRKDPRFGPGQGASKSDYREPIYDQGHLANDADLQDDFIQQLNSYVMSNMSPQECRFNRGIWLSLEHLTRIWAESVWRDIRNLWCDFRPRRFSGKRSG